MASSLVEEELKCPICKEFLTDPVTLDCGHNFCTSCITNFGEKWEGLGDLECPLCKARIKKGNFRPNWQLANIVKNITLLPVISGKEDFCGRHKEKFNLFCKEDKELICVHCERSPEHRPHTVLLLKEAAKEYKDQFLSILEYLMEEKESIQVCEKITKEESEELLKQAKAEKEKMLEEFRQLIQFLEKRKNRLLTQIEAVEMEIAGKRDEHMAKLSEELAALQNNIQEIEQKLLQPPSEFLKDVKSTLQRFEKRERPKLLVAFPPVLKWRICQFNDINLFLKGVIQPFSDTLVSGFQLQKANVTLDPDTAHPKLILPEDCKSVKWGEEYQDLPRKPERFEKWPFVLGHEEFTAGRHCWVVSVEGGGEWAVGVAKKSVRRKDMLTLRPEDGIWAVGKKDGRYWALTHPSDSLLCPSEELKRIRVTLNCAGGQVAFFDDDTEVLLYKYSVASGETLLPFFHVFQGCLTLPP